MNESCINQLKTPTKYRLSVKLFEKFTWLLISDHLLGKRDRDNNNRMERLNGEIWDREKVFRGLKKTDTEILNGMMVCYNYVKKHGGLKGQTPAESALISVDGKNKWKAIIQNASLSMEGNQA